jgi:hypothetical protein
MILMVAQRVRWMLALLLLRSRSAAELLLQHHWPGLSAWYVQECCGSASESTTSESWLLHGERRKQLNWRGAGFWTTSDRLTPVTHCALLHAMMQTHQSSRCQVICRRRRNPGASTTSNNPIYDLRQRVKQHIEE